MKKTSIFVVLASAIAALALGASTATAAPPTTDAALTVPVTGTTDSGATFVGTYTLERFTTQGGALAAVGSISGTLTDADGTVIGTVTDVPLTAPVQASATCQILHLELGPLDLDLLGLVVHLDQVVLDITAESGPGNLLGNLLCGIAGLLDGGATSNVIARLLNQLLALL